MCHISCYLVLDISHYHDTFTSVRAHDFNMASGLSLDRVSGLFSTHRTAAISTLGIAVAIPFAINDYRTYLSYGPGGLPYNITGWLITSILRVFSREQLSTSIYDDKKLSFTDEPGLLPTNFLSQRSSCRPRIGPHPVPQRQLEQLPSEEIRQKLIASFEQLGHQAQVKGLIEVRQSLFERQHSALFVSKTREWHSLAQQTRGEISHIHAGLDGSIHVVLHPTDCRRVIESGWGQRHGLDGVTVLKKIAGFSLPVNYVLIYAPRDEAEIEVAMMIVKASVGFMTGAREASE